MRLLHHCLIGTLAVLLIFSFGLHSIDYDHTHYGEANLHSHAHHNHTAPAVPAPEIEEYLHGIEQKFFLLIVLALIWSTVFLANLYPRISILLAQTWTNVPFKLARVAPTQTYNYLQRLFACGLLNPKLH